MADNIRILIAETDLWRVEHVRHGRQIEALACAIRVKALRDALAAIEGRRNA